MKKLLFIFAATLFCVPVAWSQPGNTPGLAQIEDAPIVISPKRRANNEINNTAGKIDLSSPESAVRSFVWAVNMGDLKAATLCVQNPQPPEKFRDMQMAMKADIESLNLRIDALHFNIRDDIASVALLLTNTAEFPGHEIDATCERLHLEMENNLWKIVPDSKWPQPDEDWMEEDTLAEIVRWIAEPNHETNMKPMWNIESCLFNNMEKIGEAVLQLVNERDGIFPKDGELKKYLKPNVIGDRIYNCPNDEHQTGYSLNSELLSQPLAGMNDSTILLYEGQKQQIEFRHHYDGRDWTNIVLSDGTTQSFTREKWEAALKNGTVRWKP